MDLWLALPGGLVIGAVIGLLGGGGALMAIPVLLYLFHFPFRVAVGSSLALVAIGALPAIGFYWRKRQIHWPGVLQMGGGGVVGALLGTWLSPLFPKEVLLWLLILLMLVSAYNMLRPRPIKTGAPADLPSNWWKLALIGLAIGVLTGLVGVGGGFLLVPALVLVGGYEARIAIATSLVVIGVNALSGVVGYLPMLPVGSLTFWTLIISCAGGSILGYVLSFRLSESQLKQGFGYLLALLALLLILAPPGA